MPTQDFVAYLKTLQDLPAEKLRELSALAERLTDAERRTIATHLTGIDTDLARNTRQQTGLLARADLALDQIQQHDITPLTSDA